MQGSICWHDDALNSSKVYIYLAFAFYCLSGLGLATAQPNISTIASSDYWLIELLPFNTRPAAEGFVERLASKGMQTEIVVVDRDGVISYRTQTGFLFLSFADAVRYRNRLKEKTNLHDAHMVIHGPLRANDIGWHINLMRYQSKAEAEDFVKTLGYKDFAAVITALDISGRRLFQVSTLHTTKAEARDYRKRLKHETNILDQHIQIISPSTFNITNLSSGKFEAGLLEPKSFGSVAVVAGVLDEAIANASFPRLPISSESRLENIATQKNPNQSHEASHVSVSGIKADIPSHFYDDWHIYGSNTWRSDVYKSKGNLAATPYRFSDTQSYDELNLNIDHQLSPFNHISGQMSGLIYNDSLYRSQVPGSVLERINLRQENGEFMIPYRAEAGDFFAFQSFRTIQRSLKGGRIEFQPTLGGTDFHHSIELFSGAASPAWDNFQYKDDFSSGGSWLLQHSRVGSLAANLVFNHKQANGLAQQGLKQRVGSLAWEKRAAMFGQKLMIEAEVGRFIGDHPQVLAGRPNTHRQANGYFAQISGSPDTFPQFSYRFRGESYEQDYVPNGASIQSDRNSQEAYLTWRTARGLAFATRFQHYHTAWQTSNPSNTITYGGNISGMIPTSGGISGSIDAFGSEVKSRDLTSNTMAKVVNANISTPISKDISVRSSFYYANNNDKNSVLGLNITRQYSAAIDYRLQWQGINGNISLGALARNMDQQGVRWWEGNPTVNANLIYGDHSLSLALSRLNQGSLTANNGVDTITAGLNYRYTQAKYIIGVDTNWYDRQPNNAAAAWTNAWRIGAYLTYNFDKPMVKRAVVESSHGSAAPVRPSIERILIDITRLAPGALVNDVKAMVSAVGLGEPSDQAGFLIWYAQIFRDMSQNQRLVLDVQKGRVLRSAVMIDFFDSGNSASMRAAFEHMRRQLLAVYGSPDNFFNQGDFGSNIAIKLANNRFIQVMQWKRDGNVLRFGIPRRLDGKVRMELQFGRDFPSLNDPLWSMEEVQ